MCWPRSRARRKNCAQTKPIAPRSRHCSPKWRYGSPTTSGFLVSRTPGMADSFGGRHVSARPGGIGSAPPPDPDQDDGFAELRSLLIGPEQRELLALHEHLFDPSVQARDVSRVLPDAIALRAADP